MPQSLFSHLWQRYLKPAIIGLVVLAGLFIIYQQLPKSAAVSDKSADVFLQQYQKIAATHHSRYLDYTALCTENPPLRTGYFCHANSNQYRVYGVENNQLYCADATGYRGPVATLAEGGFYCQAP